MKKVLSLIFWIKCVAIYKKKYSKAIKIYERSGFDEVGNRKDYYPAKFGREDALILAKQLTDKMWINNE